MTGYELSFSSIASFLVMIRSVETVGNMVREEDGATGNQTPVTLAYKNLPGSSGEGIISVCSVCIFMASVLREHQPTMCLVGAEVAMC